MIMQTSEQLAAELYDISVPDWDGEIDFYRELAHEARARKHAKRVIEVACGTGRVTLRLARKGVDIVGADLDEEMLKVARRKSEGVSNVRWVRGDMRTLDLGESFGLIIVPGHSFQFMLTPQDQVKALETFKRHLVPGGILVIHLDHQDVDWLGDLLSDLGGKFKKIKEVTNPQTGHVMRKSNAWTYEGAMQTATVISRWEELAEDLAFFKAGNESQWRSTVCFHLKWSTCLRGWASKNAWYMETSSKTPSKKTVRK